MSIIINNFDYGRFIVEAIESALHQSYPNTEIIVVDDGSTANSREIISGYRDPVKMIFKPNRGHLSGLNVGFEANRGDIVCLLNADDLLLLDTVDKAVGIFCREPETVQVHWPLWVIDEKSHQTGKIYPEGLLDEGNLRETIMRQGPKGRYYAPTSCNAWRRTFLESVFPLAEIEKEMNLSKRLSC